jgi:hypothetical protein
MSEVKLAIELSDSDVNEMYQEYLKKQKEKKEHERHNSK